jgi:hypothetical protein
LLGVCLMHAGADRSDRGGFIEGRLEVHGSRVSMWRMETEMQVGPRRMTLGKELLLVVCRSAVTSTCAVLMRTTPKSWEPYPETTESRRTPKLILPYKVVKNSLSRPGNEYVCLVLPISAQLRRIARIYFCIARTHLYISICVCGQLLGLHRLIMQLGLLSGSCPILLGWNMHDSAFLSTFVYQETKCK